MEEWREDGEDGEQVDLGDEQEFCWMHVVPMSKLMRWNMAVSKEILIISIEIDKPSTASTSSVVLCLIKVSKTTMCLLWQKED